MKIAINALSAKKFSGGGLTYILNLIPKLSEIDQKNEYLILIRKEIHSKISSLQNKKNFKIKPVKIQNIIGRIFYEQIVLPFILVREKVDILYSPAEMTSILSSKKIILALRNPNLYTDLKIPRSLFKRIKLILLKFFVWLSVRKAKRIISVSECWRPQISKKMGIPISKIVTIHHGVSNRFINISNNEYERKKDYILSVSNIFSYKNYLNLIKAYAILVNKNKISNSLIIIGKSKDDRYFNEMFREIYKNNLRDKVQLLGYLNHDLLPAYYQNALIFIFPSYLETFGIPLIEAMASSLPIAASDIPIFRELAKDSAIYFNAFDPKDISEKIKLLINNANLRDELSKKALKRSNMFSWEKTAKETLKVFEEVYQKNHI